MNNNCIVQTIAISFLCDSTRDKALHVRSIIKAGHFGLLSKPIHMAIHTCDNVWSHIWIRTLGMKSLPKGKKTFKSLVLAWCGRTIDVSLNAMFRWKTPRSWKVLDSGAYSGYFCIEHDRPWGELCHNKIPRERHEQVEYDIAKEDMMTLEKKIAVLMDQLAAKKKKVQHLKTLTDNNMTWRRLAHLDWN